MELIWCLGGKMMVHFPINLLELYIGNRTVSLAVPYHNAKTLNNVSQNILDDKKNVVHLKKMR